jgi:hypothetical protein
MEFSGFRTKEIIAFQRYGMGIISIGSQKVNLAGTKPFRSSWAVWKMLRFKLLNHQGKLIRSFGLAP